MLSFFPQGVLDEIWDLIESASEGFPSYSYNLSFRLDCFKEGVREGNAVVTSPKSVHIHLFCDSKMKE